MLALVERCILDRGSGRAPEIAHAIGADVDAVRGVLDHLVRLGRIERQRPACRGCTACDVAEPVYHRSSPRPR